MASKEGTAGHGQQERESRPWPARKGEQTMASKGGQPCHTRFPPKAPVSHFLGTHVTWGSHLPPPLTPPTALRAKSPSKKACLRGNYMGCRETENTGLLENPHKMHGYSMAYSTSNAMRNVPSKKLYSKTLLN